MKKAKYIENAFFRNKNPHIFVRDFKFDDYISVHTLIRDYEIDFKDDFTEVTDDSIRETCLSENTMVMDCNGYPIGAFTVNNVLDKVRGEIHFIIRPKFLKMAIESAVFVDALLKIFKKTKIKKLTCMVRQDQTTAIKLLKGLGFYQHNNIFFKHTKKNGVLKNCYYFELRKTYFLNTLKKMKNMEGEGFANRGKQEKSESEPSISNSGDKAG